MKLKMSAGITLGLLIFITGASSLSAAEYEACTAECDATYLGENENNSSIDKSHPLVLCYKECITEDPKAFKKILKWHQAVERRKMN
jgi:hypothetical protein